jgi:hypothetical protein
LLLGSISSNAPSYKERFEVRQFKGPWLIVVVVLGLLALGEIYSLSKLGSISSLQSEQASLCSQFREMNHQLAAKLSRLQDANAQELDALRSELETTAKRAKSPAPTRAVVRALAKLEEQTQEQSAKLQAAKADLAEKADNEQVAAVTKDVAATRTELGSTEQTLTTLQHDLGITRSDMGTLIARNHDGIETLRKLGQRDYYEFTLVKNQEQRVAGVGLILKKANVKRHRFSLSLLADDMTIPKDNRTVDEPIFFTIDESRQFDELLIYTVDRNKVTGYISMPKYSQPSPGAAPATGE